MAEPVLPCYAYGFCSWIDGSCPFHDEEPRYVAAIKSVDRDAHHYVRCNTNRSYDQAGHRNRFLGRHDTWPLLGGLTRPS